MRRSASGTDDEELGEQSVERFLPVLERSADDEDELLSGDGRDEKPRLPVDALDVAREVERAVSRSLDLLRGDDRRAVRIDDLGEGFVVPGGEVGVRPLLTYERREGPGPRGQALVELLLEGVAEPHVEERADRGQHDGHREGEGEGEPDADRQAAHDPSSLRRRYPTPRTVSSDLRPKGRSTLSRR